MKLIDRHPPKNALGLFDQLNEALGISTRRNNLVVNLTQAPRKPKPINDTKFSVPKKFAVEQAGPTLLARPLMYPCMMSPTSFWASNHRR